jgi:hypothetical protein
VQRFSVLRVRETLASRSTERIAPLFAHVFCLTVGPFLFVNGILGLVFAPTSLRTGDDLPHRGWNFFFQFNSWHQMSHIVTGAVLVLAASRRTWLPVGLLAIGVFYAVVAPLGFIDGSDVLDVIYSDGRDNVIHTLLALQALVLGVSVLRLNTRASLDSRSPGAIQL